MSWCRPSLLCLQLLDCHVDDLQPSLLVWRTYSNDVINPTSALNCGINSIEVIRADEEYDTTSIVKLLQFW